MSDIKISEMTETTNVNDNDIVPIVQNGANKKISFINLLNNFIKNKLIKDNFSDSTTEAYSASYINDEVGSGIIEVVENANGKAIKYANGIMIITQRYSKTITSWNSWGNMYSAQLGVPPQFPVAFIETPVATQSIETNGANFWCTTHGETQGTISTTRANSLQIVRPTSYSGSITVYVDVVAIGKWN